MKTSRARPQRIPSLAPRSAPFIVILGGARSGKSRFAVDLANRYGRHIVYVATCRPGDREMRARIARHRRERPAHWRTLEPSSMRLRALGRLTGKVSGVLVDDLTMWMADLLRRTTSEARVLQHVTRFCETLHRLPVPVILVTNDVGSGVVPPSRLGRRFRDLAGLANQIATQFADDVYLLVAGIPLQLKGHS